MLGIMSLCMVLQLASASEEASVSLWEKIQKHVDLKAKIESEVTLEENYDLDSKTDDSKGEVESIASLAVTIMPHEKIKAYANLGVAHEYEFTDEAGSTKDRDFEVRLSEAYILFGEMIKNSEVTIGRQKFTDKRAWFYAAKIDAFRYVYSLEKLLFDFSVGRGGIVERDLFSWDESKDIINYIFKSEYKMTDNNTSELHVLYSHGYDDAWVRPFVVGASSYGSISNAFTYWSHIAWTKGREHVKRWDGDERTFSFQGFGFDAGCRYEFDVPLKPSLCIGYAFGSGDDEPNNGDSEGFRQSGLQYNYARLNGITDINYYGELFKPELSNLNVVTAGVGVRPHKKVSAEIVYHYYVQHKHDSEIKYSSLDADPLGLHRELGQEIDFILAVNRFYNFDLKATFGIFLPGEAFASSNDSTALLGKVQVRYKF